MNKSTVDEIIETFDAEIWKKEVPVILKKYGIKVFEKWIEKHKDDKWMIDRFVDVFIECYGLFSPIQPRNIYTKCFSYRIIDIVNCVHLSGDHVKYAWLIKDYARLRI